MQIFDAAGTADLLPYASLVAALEQGMASDVNVPERRHHDVEVDGEPVRTLITMPAWGADGAIGVKLVNVVPANADRGIPSISAIYVLFDRETGRPAALLDGTELTARRTAAVAAVAGRRLSDPDSRTHLIVGAGAVARHFAPAYAQVRSFDRTMIWARKHEKAIALATRLTAEGFPTEAIESLEAGVRAADVVSCATMAAEPIIAGRWLRPGAHIDLMGSYRPGMREADDDAIRAVTLYVDSLPGALTDAGELADPIARGVILENAVSGDLRALVTVPPTRESDRRTVFKSVGNARWDYLCAQAAWRSIQARAAAAT